MGRRSMSRLRLTIEVLVQWAERMDEERRALL